MSKTSPVRSLLGDAWFLLALAVVAGSLAFAASVSFGPNDGPRRPGAAGAFTHVRCEVCGDEHLYTAALVGEQCENCSASTYRPTINAAVRKIPWSRIVFVAVLAATLLFGLAHVGVRRWRVIQHRASEERNLRLVYRCPICGRKIGYAASKIGSVHICPGCKTAFALPALDDPAAPG